MSDAQDLVAVKKALHALCNDHVQERITIAEQAMKAAQDSANNETKSSMGDKYETSRAMMQLEKEKSARQLAEAAKLQQVLNRINPEQRHQQAQLGSLIITDQGKYYLTVGIGKLQVEGETFFVISPVAPLGQALKGKYVGAQVLFNQRTFTIQQIV